MKKTMNILMWVYPFFLGVFIFNILRVITDFTREDSFWPGDIKMHFISLFFIILFCYVSDFYWRFKWLKDQDFLSDKRLPVVYEYCCIFLQIFIPLNIMLYIGEKIGIFYLGNGIVDYILANVSFIPFLLIYYTLLRNERMNKVYHYQAILMEQLKSEKSETELNYLKAQYHPHFLFNALNTIYFQINESQELAKQTVSLLAELLRYQLYDVSRLVPICREIEFIRNYMLFQQQRISEKVTMDIQIDDHLKDQMIHPLLFQPLLENAFKYVGGDNSIKIAICYINGSVKFTVENSIFENVELYRENNKGIGIPNLRRRLELLYPDSHTFLTERREKTFYTEMIIKPNQNGN